MNKEKEFKEYLNKNYKGVVKIPLIIFLSDIYKLYTCSLIMDFIKSELNKEFEIVGFTNQRRNLKVLEQVGKTNKSRDKKREALMPGKRVSKTGKVYWETRKNRSDSRGSKV